MCKLSVSIKRLAPVAAILAILIPTAGHALGLGDIAMKSAFYQPLDAQIELLSVGKIDLNQLVVKLGSREDFKRIDLARTFFLTKIKFKVVTRKNGTAYIQLTTTQTVAEAFLDFVVEAHWPRGRILREFTVLVDLPVLSDEAPAPMQQAAIALQAAAPAVTRRVPAPAARPAPTQSRATMAPVSRQAGELTYGPVKYSDTLSIIANTMRPDGVSADQMMLALVRSNPNAFYNGNVNQLKSGYMLRVDDPSELSAYSVADANAEINRQHNEWQARKSGKLVPQAESPTGDQVARSEDTRAGKGADQASLRLVASGSRDAGSGTGDRSVNQLREDLLLAAEVLDAHRQETEELKVRMAEMAEQLKAMQRIIMLRDNETQALLTKPDAESTQAATETLAEDSAAPAAPAPIEEESGFLDDPMVMYSVPAVLLFIIAMVIQLRRRMQDGYEESILNIGGGEDDAGVSADSMGGTSGIETDATDVDPVSEADVSLTNGRHQQAEDILNKALEKEPERHELKLKLLEVFFAAGNREFFELQAQKFHDALGDESDPMWSRVVTMGAQLCPGSDLFAGDSAEALKEDLEEASSEVEDNLLELEFDIDSVVSAETKEDTPVIEIDVADVGPISIACFYMDYGRHQQAEDILNKALEKEPERHELKLKLLEVFFAAGNGESFELQAQDFHDALGDESDPMWSRVVTMGAQLCPGSDLFAGDSAEALKEDLEEATSEVEDDLLELEFDINSVVSAETKEGAPAKDSADTSSDDNILDFDLNSDSTGDATETSSDDDGLDFDPGDTDETEDSARYKKNKQPF